MRGRLTYANIVGTLALVLAIAGGTAAALPGKGSVQANDLRKNSVKAIAIAKNAVGSAEIKDGAVKSPDVADGSLTYGDLASNSVVARMRAVGPIETGAATQANPITVPLEGATWTQAADETQVFFGETRFTKSGPCTTGGLVVAVEVDGNPILTDGFSQYYDAGATVNAGTYTESFLRSRPWLHETGAEVPHSAVLKVWDVCNAANESLTLEELRVNVVGMR
jgi:hypothetical protein